jgi:uncharacterized membrane protein YvbJ
MSGKHKSKNDWKKEIKEEQNYKCAQCGETFGARQLQIHHKKINVEVALTPEKIVVQFVKIAINGFTKLMVITITIHANNSLEGVYINICNAV